MSRVALVFPYFRTRAPTELLFPPLGVAALSAQLHANGIDARVFDCTFLTPRTLRRELVSYRPDVVGLSVMVGLTAAAFRVATMVREALPESLLVAGGPLPTVFPQRFMPHVDAVFRGEADLSFPRFCADLVATGGTPASLDALPLATYPGLSIHSDRLEIENAPIHHTEAEIAGFPLPDRRDADHAAYQREWLATTGHKTTSLIATFGCPFSCDFCSKPVFGQVVRRRGLDAVLREVEQVRGLGYDSLWIGDDLFTLDEPYLEEFCRRIAPLSMTWSCLSRPNGVSSSVARRMREAGCTRVYLGLESGDQATLELMNKRITVAQGVHSAHVYHRAGIEVGAFFIVGYPGETMDAIERTFAFALDVPLDHISFNVPMPLPGSRLFERLGQPDEGRDWTHENEVTFVYPSEIAEDWLRRRIEETMGAFAARRAARASDASRLTSSCAGAGRLVSRRA
jgi:anaerobic magnesium-protoporphyrin IX monomethyl ester cyclase